MEWIMQTLIENFVTYKTNDITKRIEIQSNKPNKLVFGYSYLCQYINIKYVNYNEQGIREYRTVWPSLGRSKPSWAPCPQLGWHHPSRCALLVFKLIYKVRSRLSRLLHTRSYYRLGLLAFSIVPEKSVRANNAAFTDSVGTLRKLPGSFTEIGRICKLRPRYEKFHAVIDFKHAHIWG